MVIVADAGCSVYWLMRELDITYLHLNTNKADIPVVKRLLDVIDPKANLVVKDYVPALQDIKRNTNPRYTCVLCKRGMYREAEKLAKEISAKFIVTGENLAQVASQTLQNLRVLDESVSMPVLRPLLTFDKEDTIRIARKIGTFDISSKDAGHCAFVPDKPITMAKIEKVLYEESKLES
jgi:thiamine biosynthesis protein ThiI